MLRVLLPLLAAFAATAALTPVVRALARRHGMIARPSSDRWHRWPTALLGGVAIYAGCLVGLLVTLAMGSDLMDMSAWWGPGMGILLGATILFAGGLVDDHKKLRPSTKLIIQLIAASVVVSFGVTYPITPWQPVNVLATLLWFLALSNAMNLLDNMDGVAAGVGAIAAAFLALTFSLEGEWVLAGACAALMGATLGFLPYNFHPASIFMGDSGSLVIGGVLASLGAAYPGTAPSSIVSVLFVPVFIVIIPILDTTLVTFMRTSVGRPISMGGRDHTSHRLVAMGLSESQAALLLYAFALSGGLLAMVLRGVDDGMGLVLAGVFLVALAILAAYLGRLHTYDPESGRLPRRITVLVSELFYKRRALEVLMDIVLFAAAYYGAYLLRYEGRIPPSQLLILEGSLGIVVAAKAAAFGLVGVYRGVWQQISLADMHRLAKATALGTLISAFLVMLVFRETDFSRSVLLLDGLLVGFLTIAARSSFRSLDAVRHSLLNGKGSRTLIYGAGKGGELVVRELLSNPELGLAPLGYLDDDRSKWGLLIHGLPVIGGTKDLASIVARKRVEKIVVGTKKIGDDHLEAVTAQCRRLQVDLLHLHLELRSAIDVRERNGAAPGWWDARGEEREGEVPPIPQGGGRQ